RVKCNRSCRILEMAGDSEAKLERNGSMTLIRAWAIPVACLLRVPLLVLLAGSFRRPSSKWIQEAAVGGTDTRIHTTSSSVEPPKVTLLDVD
ncbi:unnamed protein product, partial [Musa hybrid cultivar]